MDIKCFKPKFRRLYSGKTEIENEKDYSLSEYLPNISRIIKTEVKTKVLQKYTENGRIVAECEATYVVLYMSDPMMHLKSTVFNEEFTAYFDIREDIPEDARVEIVADAFCVSCSAKQNGTRKICARSKICVSCDAFLIHSENSEDNAEKNAENGIECLTENTVECDCSVLDNNEYRLREEIVLDDEMPEISEILYVSCSVIPDKNSIHDGNAVIDSNILFSCLYETVNEETRDYIYIEKKLPFSAKFDVDIPDEYVSSVVFGDILSVSAETASDNYGDQKLISLECNINFSIYAFRNSECVICNDAYSTEKNIITKKNKLKLSSFCGVLSDNVCVDEHLRIDFRGIGDIVFSSCDIHFSDPEYYEGKLVVNAKGHVSVFGLKEDGSPECVFANINSKIVLNDRNSDQVDLSSDYRFFGRSKISSHKCSISGGELLLELCVSSTYAVFKEKQYDAVCGFEFPESAASENKNCGFTVYYPEKGESVWNVAKEHFVSCERIKNENGIGEDYFSGDEIVILH